MHPDKKVGLALGILLIGITGAFFFRNEVPEAADETPVLTDVERIDQRIRHRSGSPTPYLPARPESDSRPADLSSVPDQTVADVIPTIPSPADTAVPVPLPDPIRPYAPSSADQIVPVPRPAAELGTVEATLTHPGAGPGAGRPGPAASGTTSTAGQRAASDPKAEQAAAAERYEVQPGDTLSGISERKLGTHRRFLELYEANRDILNTPDDLRPGMNLRIPHERAAGVATLSASPVPNSPAHQPAPGNVPKPDERSSQSSPAFVRPDRKPGVPGRRTTSATDKKSASAASRSLSQSAPPGVPVVRDFVEGSAAPVIASRPDDSPSASGASTKK